MIQAKNSYDEAVLNLEVETKNWNAANTKYQLGSISRMEYLQAEAGLVQAQMDREVKNLDLFQAMESGSRGHLGSCPGLMDYGCQEGKATNEDESLVLSIGEQ